MTPTTEQLAIIEAARASKDSLFVDAMAGCAKTTSLILLAKNLPMVPSVALAFNVRIKQEIEKKLPPWFTTMTLNGLGHRAWGKTIGKKMGVDSNKMKDCVNEALEELRIKDEEGIWSETMTLARGARHAGLIPAPLDQQFRGLLPDNESAWEAIAGPHYIDLSDINVLAARRTLQIAIRRSFAGLIDYDDQIYMPTLFGGIFPRFAVTMVDEAQDLSPLNHKQISRAAADRLIVCGDPRQAIYAFRGADSSSMESLRGLRSAWVELPLTTTFRCPKVIVARQQTHAPGFTAADVAPEGEFHDWTDREWSIADIENAYRGQHIALICRNNAPIIAAALRIIRSGRGCTVLGREIGKALVNLSKKILPNDDIGTQACIELIAAWQEREIAVARANKKEEKVAQITDRAECLLAVVSSEPDMTSGKMRKTLQTMFSKENLAITLSTGHKSKGLEWPVVVHLDAWRIPSPFARDAHARGNSIPLQQDMNLRYVIETRAQKVLINADLETML